MDSWQNYLSMFSYLDKYYIQNKLHDNNKLIDDLGSLLGSMNPRLFEDKLPADQALFNDWQTLTGKEAVNITLVEGFENMTNFLELQQEKFKLDLGSLITYLRNIVELNVLSDSWQLWVECCQQNLLDTRRK